MSDQRRSLLQDPDPRTFVRPTTGLGATLGAGLGAAAAASLWQGGVLPPDRLVGFTAIAVAIAAGAWLLTPAPRSSNTRLKVVAAGCALLMAIAVAGVPEFVRGGEITGDCDASVVGALPTVPDDTSATSPLDVDSINTVEWSANSDRVLTDWRGSVGLRLLGFDVPLWRFTPDNSTRSREWHGEFDLQTHLNDVRGLTGLNLTGTYPVYGSVVAPEGTCTARAYVRIVPDHPFDGPILITLWVLLACGGTVFALLARAARPRATAPRSDAQRDNL